MCGEKSTSDSGVVLERGSPPRVRGKVGNRPLWRDKRGITPACAGKSSMEVRVLGTVTRITPACAGKRHRFGVHFSGGQDHPRVCGEKTKKIPFNAPKTAFSSVLCQISFNFSYSMSVNVQSARARCVSLISIPKCRHKSCNV